MRSALCLAARKAAATRAEREVSIATRWSRRSTIKILCVCERKSKNEGTRKRPFLVECDHVVPLRELHEADGVDVGGDVGAAAGVEQRDIVVSDLL